MNTMANKKLSKRVTLGRLILGSDTWNETISSE
jgi:hypothetical protein